MPDRKQLRFVLLVLLFFFAVNAWYVLIAPGWLRPVSLLACGILTAAIGLVVFDISNRNRG